MEEHKLKYLNAKQAKEILEIADYENIDVEAIIDFIKKLKGGKIKMSNQEDDERFSKELKIVEKYQEDHPGVSYRDAVLASLDRTESLPKKEFTAEEIKEQEQLKVVENYLDANPRATYSEACKILFKGEKPTLKEKLIEEYMEKNPGSDYKTAVIESLSLLEKEEKEE